MNPIHPNSLDLATPSLPSQGWGWQEGSGRRQIDSQIESLVDQLFAGVVSLRFALAGDQSVAGNRDSSSAVGGERSLIPDPTSQYPVSFSQPTSDGPVARSMPFDNASRLPFSTTQVSALLAPAGASRSGVLKASGRLRREFHVTGKDASDHSSAGFAADVLDGGDEAEIAPERNRSRKERRPTPYESRRSRRATRVRSTAFWLSENQGWRFPPQVTAPLDPSPDVTLAPPLSVNTQQVLAQCLSCGDWVLPTPRVIQKHEVSLRGGQLMCHHNKNGQFTCGDPDCKETFASLRARTLHMTRVHRTAETNCRFCVKILMEKTPDGNSLPSYTVLAAHLLQGHLGVAGWQCQCGMELPSFEQLSKHVYHPHHPRTPPSELISQYTDQHTGLPSNAHVVDGLDGPKIVLYHRDGGPPVPNPVNWLTPPFTSP